MEKIKLCHKDCKHIDPTDEIRRVDISRADERPFCLKYNRYLVRFIHNFGRFVRLSFCSYKQKPTGEIN